MHADTCYGMHALPMHRMHTTPENYTATYGYDTVLPQGYTCA